MMTNEELIQDYIISRGLKENTYYTMKSVLTLYSEFNEMSLKDLLEEADTEEEKGIRWKKRTLKKRLINFQNYLHKQYNISSVKSYMTRVKSFYSHHEIAIGKLPSINEKNAIVSKPIKYTDLPTHDIIKQAVEMANPVMKAIILFMSSTGMSRVDTLKLTINDFLKATKDYHNDNNIRDAIETMLHLEIDIIPTFERKREKTNKFFITFCTPECTLELLHYLKYRISRGNWNHNSKLFKIDDNYFSLKFDELNTALGLGKAGGTDEKEGYNVFRSHMLRKFHASHLRKAGMDLYSVNILQGKSNNSVDEVYFLEDTEQLRKDYIKYMHSLFIFTDVNEITVESEEVLEIKKENDKLISENSMLKEQNERISNLERIVLGGVSDRRLAEIHKSL